MAETSFQALTEDLQMEILSRKSLKFLGKCICASKKLANIIRTKDFRKLYVLQSMTRPRMLFIVRELNYNSSSGGDDLLFYSVYQEEKPLLLSGRQESHIFTDYEKYKISQTTRGLICIRDTTKIMICNPTMNRIRTLLELKTCQEKLIADYIGYDEAMDELKVLYVMQMESDGLSPGAKECKVLTVGSVEESWRPIKCEHDHTPVTQGLCKEGVLYYGAKSNGKESLVMSFNVSSEDFTFTNLPKEININSSWKLVKYNGEIALVDDADPDLHENGVLQIWVRKEIEIKQEKKEETERKWEWKKTLIVLPHARWIEETVGCEELYFKGTIGTGELVFAVEYLDTRRQFSSMGSVFVLYYDTITEELRKFETEKKFEGYSAQIFLDHLDSPQLM